MADTGVDAIKACFVRITELSQVILKTGNDRRAKLGGLNVDGALAPLQNPPGTFDPALWQALSDDEKAATMHRLSHLQDTLETIGGEDGPRDPASIMYKSYATNRQVFVFLVLALVIFLTLLWRIADTWDEATGTDFRTAMVPAFAAQDAIAKTTKAITDAETNLGRLLSSEPTPTSNGKEAEAVTKAKTVLATLKADKEVAETRFPAIAAAAVKAYVEKPVTESRVLYTVMLLGALGGAMHFLGSFVKFIGNRLLMRSWLLHYLSLPFVGAALAVIVYLLLRVGLLSPNGTSGSGTQISNLNLIGIYAFSALTGLFSGPATEKLGEIFRTMFRTETASKDALKRPAEKPPGTPDD